MRADQGVVLDRRHGRGDGDAAARPRAPAPGARAARRSPVAAGAARRRHRIEQLADVRPDELAARAPGERGGRAVRVGHAALADPTRASRRSRSRGSSPAGARATGTRPARRPAPTASATAWRGRRGARARLPGSVNASTSSATTRGASPGAPPGMARGWGPSRRHGSATYERAPPRARSARSRSPRACRPRSAAAARRRRALTVRRRRGTRAPKPSDGLRARLEMAQTRSAARPVGDQHGEPPARRARRERLRSAPRTPPGRAGWGGAPRRGAPRSSMAARRRRPSSVTSGARSSAPCYSPARCGGEPVQRSTSARGGAGAPRSTSGWAAYAREGRLRAVRRRRSAQATTSRSRSASTRTRATGAARRGRDRGARRASSYWPALKYCRPRR